MSAPAHPLPGARLAEGIHAITGPLSAHFTALDAFLDAEVGAFEPEVQPLVRYTFGHSGKKIRPILVFSAGWVGEGVAPKTEVVRAAAIVELVHLATLVHDDILDGADKRHNSETATKRYGPHAAVLLGDALFAHALKLAADFPSVDVCRAVATATRQVCCGEIAQTFARGQTDLSITAYRRMLDLKTAELFALSATLGARLSGAPEAFVTAATTFARHLGIAYQLYDDLADFLATEQRAGKTLGTDLASGKYTLPVLLLLQELPPSEKALWIERLHSHTLEPLILTTELRRRGLFQRASAEFEREMFLAEECLHPFAHIPAARTLPQLSDFIRAALGKLSGHL